MNGSTWSQLFYFCCKVKNALYGSEGFPSTEIITNFKAKCHLMLHCCQITRVNICQESRLFLKVTIIRVFNETIRSHSLILNPSCRVNRETSNVSVVHEWVVNYLAKLKNNSQNTHHQTISPRFSRPFMTRGIAYCFSSRLVTYV